MATQIAEGHTLREDPFRVKGEITYEPRLVDGIRHLGITTRFVWVYAFSGDLRWPGANRVIVNDEITWLFPAPDEVPAEEAGMWIGEARAYASNIDCELAAKSLLALASDTPNVGEPTYDADDVFAPGSAAGLEGNC